MSKRKVASLALLIILLCACGMYTAGIGDPNFPWGLAIGLLSIFIIVILVVAYLKVRGR